MPRLRKAARVASPAHKKAVLDFFFSNRGLSHTAKESNAQTHNRTNAQTHKRTTQMEPVCAPFSCSFHLLSSAVLSCGADGPACHVTACVSGRKEEKGERSRSSWMSRPAVIYIHLCTISAFCTCVCDTCCNCKSQTPPPSTALHPVCTSSQTRTPPPHPLPASSTWQAVGDGGERYAAWLS